MREALVRSVLKTPTTEQSQRALLKHQYKAGRGHGHGWAMRWGWLECHKETFDLCLLTPLSERRWVSFPFVLRKNITRWEKVLISEFRREQCIPVCLHKITVEKLFGL